VVEVSTVPVVTVLVSLVTVRVSLVTVRVSLVVGVVGDVVAGTTVAPLPVSNTRPFDSVASPSLIVV